MARRTVAVVGGGCSGVLITRELLRCTDREVVVIEPGEPGGGMAYGAAQPWHLLNSRADLRATGALRVRGGGVRSVTRAPDGGLLVEFGPTARHAETAEVRPGGPADPRRFAAVVNCSGPGRLPGAAGPLVGGLLAAGLVRVGPHGLGLDIDASGRLIAADGTVQRRLWLVGPLRRGARWETTAVPEIRAQARRLATDLAATVAEMPLPHAA